MEKNEKFPNNKELREAVLTALKHLGGSGTTQEINKKAIEVLNLSEEVINLEYPDGLCTMLDYKLRLVRTGLKGKGLISNSKRGIWEIID